MMSLYHELANMSEVLAAGEYSFRGDRYAYAGELTDEMARIASIMCRATSMAVHMQVNIMKSLGSDCGCAPSRGWVVHGRMFSVCVIGNIFCFFMNEKNSLNKVLSFMKDNVSEQNGEKI